MSKKYWNVKHQKYAETDWINMPSIFSQIAIKYFPSKGRLLDVGCGRGQDSRYFAETGYDVICIDFSQKGTEIAHEKSKYSNVNFLERDIREGLPFEDATFDVVYSHLALHYFDKNETEYILQNLARVLKRGGILALFVNSINDPEYGICSKIEDDYFIMGEINKRYYSSKSLESLIKGFEILLSNEDGETYKDRAISVSHLVQYVGRKIYQ